jgi:Protein kinase domain
VEELGSGDPRNIGPYQLLGRLGSGGMGQVFLAQSPGGRRVAVKVIRPDLADAPDFRRRFAREVAAAQRVSGIFTAPVVDADPEARQPWLVTAYVEGPSLADYVARKGAMPESEVISLGCALAEGLGAIHAAGIVHRDLKPSNVLLASDGPRIIDFGISRAVEATSLTESGLIVGSPGYMSPEQADGREVGAASDVFSMGAVLAFAATGTEPFGTGAASALLYRVVHGEPALTGLSDDLHEVVSACLRKIPADRPTPARLLAMLVSLGNALTLPPDGIAAIVDPPQPVSAGYSRAELSDARPASPSGGLPATAAKAMQNAGRVTYRTRRRLYRRWIALCAVIALAIGGGLALASHYSGTGKAATAGQSSGTSRQTTTEPQPRAVVEAYFAAIGQRNWSKVWQLGGKNLSPSRASMIKGFRDTSRDVITDITAANGAVAVRIDAYERTGAMQIYTFHYTVAGGEISAGSRKLISICARLQFGDDGTAVPLFCSDGRPNPLVLAYYKKQHLGVLKLGPDATPTQVVHAMCSDLNRHSSSYPVETAAYELAQKIEGWSFGISPPQAMVDGGCS